MSPTPPGASVIRKPDYSSTMYEISYFDAEKLWNDIISFAQAQWELGNEGNSGEFHDEQAQLELEIDERKAREKLQKTFEQMTGWFPMCESDNHFTFASIKPMKWLLVKR